MLDNLLSALFADIGVHNYLEINDDSSINDHFNTLMHHSIPVVPMPLPPPPPQLPPQAIPGH